VNDVRLIGESIFVAFEFSAENLAGIKAIAKSHGILISCDSTRSWKLPKRCAADVARVFGSLAWCNNFRNMMRRNKAKFETADVVLDRTRAAELKKADQPIGTSLDAMMPDGRTLRQHQREGVKWLMTKKRAILGDEMGLGKSLTGLFFGKLMNEAEGCHTIVVTRANLVENIRREAACAGHRVVSVYSHAKIPKEHQHAFTLIVDEAHDFQSMQAQRTKKMLNLALSPFCLGAVMMTGTPIKNGTPKNIFPLLRAIGHPLGRNKKDFESRYCGSSFQVFGKAKLNNDATRVSWVCAKCEHWNDQPWKIFFRKFKCSACAAEPRWKIVPRSAGCINEAELHAKLSPYLLRRFKKDCLDLPPKTRIKEEVTPSAESLAIYNDTLSIAKRQYIERVASGEIEKQGKALAILNFVRMAASKAKIEYAVDRARDIIDQGSKIVIFAKYVDTAEEIARQLEVKPYTGDTRQDIKQTLIDTFQAGDAAAFVGTWAAATGITLHAATYVMLVDRELTPADNEQAEDRLHRDGQKNAVTSIWLSAFPVDDKVDTINERKAKNISAVIDGAAATDRVSNSARELCRDLFE